MKGLYPFKPKGRCEFRIFPFFFLSLSLSLIFYLHPRFIQKSLSKIVLFFIRSARLHPSVYSAAYLDLCCTSDVSFRSLHNLLCRITVQIMVPMCRKNAYHLFPLRDIQHSHHEKLQGDRTVCFPTSPESPCTKTTPCSKKGSKSRFLLHNRPPTSGCPRVLKEGNQTTNVFANMISHSHSLFFYAIFENLEYFHKI